MITMPTVELNAQTILLTIAVVLLLANSISTLTKGKKDWAELSGRTEREADRLASIHGKLRLVFDTVGALHCRYVPLSLSHFPLLLQQGLNPAVMNSQKKRARARE